jgi:hypothetical protein
LTFGPTTYAYQANYGEPGLATRGRTIYVTTPGDSGAVMAKSTDRGRHWSTLPTVKPPSTSPGQFTSGSDSDVVVARDGTVYVGDLDIDGIEVSRSTDGGRTFKQQSFIASTSDREWLATDGAHGQDVYVGWHELATGTILVAVSHDYGKTFSAPHVVYSQPTTTVESAHNGTSIGGISTDGRGRVYIAYGITRLDTTDTTYGSPPISQIAISVSSDHGSTWHDVTVNPGAADANFGNFWMASAVDRGGFVYVVYSGYAHKGQPMHVWLQESTDHGQHWTKPYRVDDAKGSDLFGWVAGGGRGVADVAWYHTSSADKNNAADYWTVQVAQVRGLASGHPRQWTGTATHRPNHHGAICTLGLFCGVLPGSAPDRSLLDFFKVTVDDQGMAEVVWSDNNRAGAIPAGVGFARQTGGPSAYSR